MLGRGCSGKYFLHVSYVVAWILYFREFCGCLATYVIINDNLSKLGQWGFQVLVDILVRSGYPCCLFSLGGVGSSRKGFIMTNVA